MVGRGLVEAVVWWVVLLAAYLAIISKISITELVVGTITAAVGAGAAVITRRALTSAGSREGYRPRPAWLRWLRPLPAQIAGDSIRLLRPRGGFGELRLPAEEERMAALRGFAELAVSVSPGTYVVEVAPRENTFVVHRVGEAASAVEREVSR